MNIHSNPMAHTATVRFGNHPSYDKNNPTVDNARALLKTLNDKLLGGNGNLWGPGTTAAKGYDQVLDDAEYFAAQSAKPSTDPNATYQFKEGVENLRLNFTLKSATFPYPELTQSRGSVSERLDALYRSVLQAGAVKGV